MRCAKRAGEPGAKKTDGTNSTTNSCYVRWKTQKFAWQARSESSASCRLAALDMSTTMIPPALTMPFLLLVVATYLGRHVLNLLLCPTQNLTRSRQTTHPSPRKVQTYNNSNNAAWSTSNVVLLHFLFTLLLSKSLFRIFNFSMDGGCVLFISEECGTAGAGPSVLTKCLKTTILMLFW